MSEAASDDTQSAPKRQWRPLEALDRRVLGVLVEKAKTTPEAYPLSLNALSTGCNQKNNRYPLMNTEPDDVQESIDRLREMGAVAEVQGGGRVARFRHYLYEWLGVEKAELSVMAELLLRGAQTEGELRGRVARMEPLPDLNALRAILDSLKKKGLVVSLSPAGRGHVVTHALYQQREMEKLEREFAGGMPSADQDRSESAPAERSVPVATPQHVVSERTAQPSQPIATRGPSAAPADYATSESVEDLRRQVDAMRSEMALLRKDLDDLWSNFR